MRNRGLYLSFECLFSLLILIMIITTPINFGRESLEEIYVLQKQHDLIKVWIKERDFSENTLRSDFEFVFPGKSGIIKLGEREIEIGNLEEGYSTKGIAKAYYLNQELELEEMQLIVFS